MGANVTAITDIFKHVFEVCRIRYLWLGGLVGALWYKSIKCSEFERMID